MSMFLVSTVSTNLQTLGGIAKSASGPSERIEREKPDQTIKRVSDQVSTILNGESQEGDVKLVVLGVHEACGD